MLYCSLAGLWTLPQHRHPNRTAPFDIRITTDALLVKYVIGFGALTGCWVYFTELYYVVDFHQRLAAA